MKNKFNFWGVLVTPWTRQYRLLLSLYILIFVSGILGAMFVIAGRINLHLLWLILIPVPIYAINWVIGLLVDRLQSKLPVNSLLQTDCIIVNNALQTPGIAHLQNDQLILEPLVGKQLSISINELRRIRERKWYNGQGYWMQTTFFELPVSNQWRLGFGVAEGAIWRDAFNNITHSDKRISTLDGRDS